MNKKINETVEIKKFDTADARTEQHLYCEKSIMQTIGSINNRIYAYRDIYGRKPTIILISRELEILLREHANLMNQHQGVIIGDNELDVNLIFGFPCIVTPTLDFLEFEVR